MNAFDISEIEDEMRRIVVALGISERVYPNRPKAADHSADFVVVKVSGGVEDMVAFGRCTISVQLFAQDSATIKNSRKLSLMYRKLAERLPSWSGRLTFDCAPKIIGDTPDGYGYHARIINIETIIKIEQ